MDGKSAGIFRRISFLVESGNAHEPVLKLISDSSYRRLHIVVGRYEQAGTMLYKVWGVALAHRGEPFDIDVLPLAA
jgi:hypothetical protein